MRVHLIAAGRQKGGPEGMLVTDYLDRFDGAGRGLGLGPSTLVEIDDRKKRDVSAALLEAAPRDAFQVALDERGKTLDSRAFAALLGTKRDQGVRDFALMIGGADGHSQELRSRADMSLSFGPMVWPHMLARVMAAEQLYRAASILAGAPYHRD